MVDGRCTDTITSEKTIPFFLGVRSSGNSLLCSFLQSESFLLLLLISPELWAERSKGVGTLACYLI